MGPSNSMLVMLAYHVRLQPFSHTLLFRPCRAMPSGFPAVCAPNGDLKSIGSVPAGFCPLCQTLRLSSSKQVPCSRSAASSMVWTGEQNGCHSVSIELVVRVWSNDVQHTIGLNITVATWSAAQASDRLVVRRSHEDDGKTLTCHDRCF